MATISQYREREGLTLEAFATLVGKSKGHMSEVENAMRCSARLALDIEQATAGAINAADLNDEIAQARKAAA